MEEKIVLTDDEGNEVEMYVVEKQELTTLTISL